MNPEQENFDALRRLVKLKRHEVPPPGYFSNFSGQVITRIRTGGEGEQETFFEFLFEQAPWMKQFLGAFESKPAVAWGFGLAACALVISGIVYSDSVEYPQMAVVPAPSEAGSAQAFASPPMSFGQESAGQMAFTEPAAQMMALQAKTNSLFDQIQPSTQPVSLNFR